MAKFKEGDIIRRKPVPPPTARVIRVWELNGHFEIEWPSGLRRVVTRADEFELVEQEEESSNAIESDNRSGSGLGGDARASNER